MQFLRILSLCLSEAVAVTAADDAAVADRTLSPSTLLCVKGTTLGNKMAAAFAACLGAVPSSLLPPGMGFHKISVGNPLFFYKFLPTLLGDILGAFLFLTIL